jgi:threonine synthase
MPELRFASSRGSAPPVTLSEAIRQGLAPDGGLYLPTRLPAVDPAAFPTTSKLPEVARVALSGFFAGDALSPQLGRIADAALDIPAPTTRVTAANDPLYVLELFHGPTAAFKDFGARFLAETLQQLEGGGARPLTMLVKEAFVDANLSRRHRFSSANSINIGRLLPQMVYYAASSLDIERRARARASYIVPSGNLGNAFAAVWARALGFPIDRIVLAHNANRTVPDFLRTAVWEPRSSIPTLASAMDVGNPSNMERVRALFPTPQAIREQLSADSVDDATIRARIGEDFMQYGREWCPHTAVAAEVYSRLPPQERRERHWVLVATAHPAKFNDVVEPIIGKTVAIPESLDRLLHLPQHFIDLPPTLDAVAAALT